MPSGAHINHYASGGASVSVGKENSGIARNLSELKELVAAEWGPEKFNNVFGESASDSATQEYADNQAAIEKRKTDSDAAAVRAADEEEACSS